MRIISAACAAMLFSSMAFAQASADVQQQLKQMQQQLLEYQKKVDSLSQELEKVKSSSKKTVDDLGYIEKQLNVVKAHDAKDNIKWSADYRVGVENIHYKLNDGSGMTNPSLLTSRLWLNMSAEPIKNLRFFGQMAMYKTWGGNKILSSEPFQQVDWRGSSLPDDAVFKIRESYFIYSMNKDGKVPFDISIGRRPSTEGFLANWRQGDDKPGSPLAHITNMEVEAAMTRLDLSKVTGLPGAYVKLVYGRAHDPVNQTHSNAPYVYVQNHAPNYDDDGSVNFFVMPMALYNDGQFDLMGQYAAIFNSKGRRISDGKAKVAAGTTQLGALSLQVTGLNEDNDFLDDSIFFVSGALTNTNPDDGYEMLGSTKSKTGYSFWTGFIFPDTFTENGHIGIEYNYGSKYWTPMTWAEDTAIGSKIATRGNAYEAYWNLPLLGRNLSAQLRYTYLDYHYRNNTICYWESPDYDASEYGGGSDNAQDIRFTVRYQY